jgi:hypothetical protein
MRKYLLVFAAALLLGGSIGVALGLNAGYEHGARSAEEQAECEEAGGCITLNARELYYLMISALGKRT